MTRTTRECPCTWCVPERHAHSPSFAWLGPGTPHTVTRSSALQSLTWARMMRFTSRRTPPSLPSAILSEAAPCIADPVVIVGLNVSLPRCSASAAPSFGRAPVQTAPPQEPKTTPEEPGSVLREATSPMRSSLGSGSSCSSRGRSRCQASSRRSPPRRIPARCPAHGAREPLGMLGLPLLELRGRLAHGADAVLLCKTKM